MGCQGRRYGGTAVGWLPTSLDPPVLDTGGSFTSIATHLPYRHTAIPPYRHTAIPPYRHTAIPPYRHTALSAILPFLLLIHLPQPVHHVGIRQRLGIPHRPALGDVLEQPAHDLSAPGLGEIG